MRGKHEERSAQIANLMIQTIQNQGNTLREISSRTGRSHSTVYALKNGGRKLLVADLLHYCDEFLLDPHEVLEMKPPQTITIGGVEYTRKN